MKTCPTCGAQLADSVKFCANCGTKLEDMAAPQVESQVLPTINATQTTAAPQPNILVLGILSLVFGGIVGIILGAIGRKKGKEYMAAGGTLTGTAKVGFILAKAGIIVGIITTIVYAIVFIVYIGAFIGLANNGAFENLFY